MSSPPPSFDPVIHPPARLQIMAVLANVQHAEFAVLRKTVDVSDSVLSKHLSALAEAGYVQLKKAALDGRQRTWAAITGGGRSAFRRHVAALSELAGLLEKPVEHEDAPSIAPRPAQLSPDLA